MDDLLHFDSLPDPLVICEVAPLLNVKKRRVNALVEENKLAARFASREEIAELIRAGRIKGVTFKGILLVEKAAVREAMGRRGRGWPKNVPRKHRE